MYSLEELIRKASTKVSNLSNELEAAKTEVHKTNFNDSPDKINTFLQKAGVWSEKLDELLKNSKQQEQLVTDMAEALETNIQGVKDLNQEMEKLRTDINKITAKGSNNGALVTEIANLNERITSLEQGTEKHELVKNLANVANITERLVSLEEDMAKQAAKLKPDTY